MQDSDGPSPRDGDVPGFWREVRDLWRSQLSPIPTGLFESKGAPPAIHNFLVSVGLPIGPSPLDISFFHDERLLQPVTSFGRDYLLLGEDYGVATTVDPERGSVWELYLVEFRAPRFVNSSLPLFLVCLRRYLSAYEEICASPEDADRIAERLKHEFSELDPAALTDETSAWSVSLQELGDGLI